MQNIRAPDVSVSAADFVLNMIPGTAYAETLAGAFPFDGAPGYGFSGQAFAGLEGGDHLSGNWPTFDQAGLGAGTCRASLVFDGTSRFGLSDLAPAARCKGRDPMNRAMAEEYRR
ncbi:hypothetical protein L6Q21_08390 [Sandaracinobacter sp. RS1-74]|uniref:hypothetical protein n=1 Tax=Sandaracinobacteroides sayramensis TaxID=2913411 RepID=UPI001EDB4BCB|nr:hypothetical protein [Sandaracinobacteroides sayramensis]MCG2840999.1 hypothetical protein [Sandaracinobacteroides sayramensis]